MYIPLNTVLPMPLNYDVCDTLSFAHKLNPNIRQNWQGPLNDTCTECKMCNKQWLKNVNFVCVPISSFLGVVYYD